MIGKTSAKRGYSKSGLPPGTLIHVGEKHVEHSTLEIITYTSNQVEAHVGNHLDTLKQHFRSDQINWINLVGLHDTDLVAGTGNFFNLHALMLEDILNTNQRSKVELYKDHIYLTLKMFHHFEHQEVHYEQISLVLGPNYVLCFQEREGDAFETLRERLKNSQAHAVLRSADYLFYRLIDIIVDTHYTVLEHISENIETIEKQIFTDPTPGTLQRIQAIKGDLIYLRRIAVPLREAIGKIIREEPDLVTHETLKYLNDVYDHTVFVHESVESYRDIAASLMEMYLTIISNRMNEVMKVLTIIATIFIPLTFIAGIYGMNFDYLPELHWKWGYAAVWGVMITISLLMIWYFRRKRWL